jgi:hypothetical protein
MEYSWCMAQCLVLAGEGAEAIRWLRNAALDQNFSNYPLLAERDPLLAPLRGVPGFGELMAAVKRKWEAVAP